MTDDLQQYSPQSADWRSTLRRNNQRTYIVIAIFFLIYVSVGFLIDIIIVAQRYPQAEISQLIAAFYHSRLFPYATLGMLFVAMISLLISYMLYDKLMLLG